MFRKGQLVSVKKPKQYIVPRMGRLGRGVWIPVGAKLRVAYDSRGGKTVVTVPTGIGTVTYKDSDLELVS